jgi:tRNA threonylcarbamoyl adenosine modification protein YeaZ
VEIAEPLILAIETGTRRGGIALLRGKSVIHAQENVARAEDLLPQIELLLQRGGVDVRDLNLIVVSVGPGSFTGIRIGIATTMGLGGALKIPTVGIEPLLAIAATARFRTITTALSIGQGRLALQNFDASSGSPSASSGVSAISQAELFEQISSSPQTEFVICPADDESLTDELSNVAFANATITDSLLAEMIGRSVGMGVTGPLQPIYLRS